MKRRNYGPVGALSEVVRRSCRGCGGPVEWLGLGGAVDDLGVDLVNELMDRLGGFMGPDDDPDFWVCSACGEVGVVLE